MPESFPQIRLPLKLCLHSEAVGIRDANDISVCYIYFDDGCPLRRSVRRRLTKEDAIEVGKVVARALTVAIERRPVEEVSEGGD